MRITTANGQVPSQFVKFDKEDGRDVLRNGNYLGVSSVLSGPNKRDGYLDPKCQPWEFELFRLEFREFIGEREIELDAVSVRQCVFGSKVLVPQIWDGDHLGISIVNLGDGRFSVSSICRGKKPILQHMHLWREIITPAVDTDGLINKVEYLSCD